MWHLSSRILVTGFLLCPEDASHDFLPDVCTLNLFSLIHYSPDLAPSILHLLVSWRMTSEDAVLLKKTSWKTVHEELRRVSKGFYTTGWQRPTERWEKCVANEGDLVEKYSELCEVSKSMCCFGDLCCFTWYCCVIDAFQTLYFPTNAHKL